MRPNMPPSEGVMEKKVQCSPMTRQQCPEIKIIKNIANYLHAPTNISLLLSYRGQSRINTFCEIVKSLEDPWRQCFVFVLPAGVFVIALYIHRLKNFLTPGSVTIHRLKGGVKQYLYCVKICRKYKNTPKQSGNVNRSRGKIKITSGIKARVEEH